MKFSLDITDTTRITINIIFQAIIQIVFIAYYNGQNQKQKNISDELYEESHADKYKNWAALSIAGGVFILVNSINSIVINYKYLKFIVYIIIAVNSLGLLLLLVGMGIIASYFQISGQSNTAVAFWFAELALYILSLINLHSISNNQSNEQSKKPEQQQQESNNNNNNQTQANQSQLNMVPQEAQLQQQQQQQQQVV